MSESRPRPIVITGFMGAGKTSVAQALALVLGSSAVDLDEVIVGREKRSIQDLIAVDGEPGFREAETRALRFVLERGEARIIALGGGAWTLERNRLLITEHGCVTVWLDAPFELCWKRIEAEGGARPLIFNQERAAELYGERRALYELADIRIAVAEDASIDRIAAQIARFLYDEATL